MVLFVVHRTHFMGVCIVFCLHGHLGKLNSLLAAGSTENLGVLGSRFLHFGGVLGSGTSSLELFAGG